MSSSDFDVEFCRSYNARTLDWTSVMSSYARLLCIQARLQFPFERDLYENETWRAAQKVVDFGCGDGSYLRILANEFPDKRYFGIESNLDMLKFAREKHDGRENNISFHSSIEEIDDTSADFVLMRYVVMHLTDRPNVFEAISRMASPGASILVIEPDDEMYEIHPPLPLLDDALRSIKAVSRDRNLKDALDGEVRPFGFAISSIGSREISGGGGCDDQAVLEYLWALVELGLQRPLSNSEFNNLLMWASNGTRHVRFGFYSRLYALTHESRHTGALCGL